ncbi:hypothetical protein V2647_03745 [Tenacibaculum maritimum]|uniref:hypothetical protein n=1 Tax=Tenacibaculum maritimum TaxID=107401 RepID=UPI001330F1BD|nr:hypothetical protein [Tenacibaculum maritimum]
MKQPHNMKVGDKCTFNHFGEIQEFAETYEHKPEEFKFSCNPNGQLEMIKI